MEVSGKKRGRLTLSKEDLADLEYEELRKKTNPYGKPVPGCDLLQAIRDGTFVPESESEDTGVSSESESDSEDTGVFRMGTGSEFTLTSTSDSDSDSESEPELDSGMESDANLTPMQKWLSFQPRKDADDPTMANVVVLLTIVTADNKGAIFQQLVGSSERVCLVGENTPDVADKTCSSTPSPSSPQDPDAECECGCGKRRWVDDYVTGPFFDIRKFGLDELSEAARKREGVMHNMADLTLAIEHMCIQANLCQDRALVYAHVPRHLVRFYSPSAVAHMKEETDNLLSLHQSRVGA